MLDLSLHNQILIYGGSFDPPHVAHVALPKLAMQAIGADAVAYVPAAQAPHKRDRVQTPARHRLAMLRLALVNEPWACVLTDEIDRAGAEPSDGAAGDADRKPSFTVDTLEALHRRLPAHVILRLLIGADQVRIFHTWKLPDRIIELAEPLVMLRPPDTKEHLLASLPPGYDPNPWSMRIVELPQMDVNSTDIRRRVAGGEPISDLVCPAVEAYIREHGLYGG